MSARALSTWVLAMVLAIAPIRAARALELLMVDRAGCIWCERWEREVAPAYMKSEEGQKAPLRRHSLDQGQPNFQLKEPVRFTPTFILLDENREIGRIIGYLDNAMFWGLLGSMLNRLEQPPARN